MSTPKLVVDIGHVQRSFREFSEFRRNSTFCDITLKVGGQEIIAHKSMLASCSSFFKAMFDDSFCESKQDSVELQHNTTYEIMCIIVDYLYSGKLIFHPDDVCLLIENMNYLGVECETIFKKIIDHKNCIPLYVWADEAARVELKEIAITYILGNFEEIIVNGAFNTISKNQLIDVLKRVDSPKADIMYEVAMSWLKQDENRSGELTEEVLSYVPVKYLSHTLIRNKIIKDEFLRDNFGGCRWLFSSILDNPARFSVNVSEKSISLYIMSQDHNPYFCEFKGYFGSVDKSQTRPEMADCSFTMYKDMIYVVAGKRDGIPSNVGLRYDTNERVWAEFDCKVGRVCCGTCSRHNKLLLVGGNIEGQFQSACSSYDYDTGRIVDLPNMMQRRSRPGVSVYNSSIYVFGGIAADDPQNMIERFDPREGQWCIAGFLDYRTSCSSAVLGDSVYCLKTGSADIVRYDPRTTQKTPVFKQFCYRSDDSHSTCCFNHRSKGHCLGIDNGTLYILYSYGVARYWPEKDCSPIVSHHVFAGLPIFVA